MTSPENIQYVPEIRDIALGWIPSNCVKAQIPIIIDYQVENPPGTLKVEYNPGDDVVFANEVLSIRYVEPITGSTQDSCSSTDPKGIYDYETETCHSLGSYALQIWIELDPKTSFVSLFSREIGKNREGFVDSTQDRIELKSYSTPEEMLVASFTGAVDKDAPDYEKEIIADYTKFTKERVDEILQIFERIDNAI